MDFKREAQEKIDSAFALWGGRQYVAVDLLDEMQMFLICYLLISLSFELSTVFKQITTAKFRMKPRPSQQYG